MHTFFCWFCMCLACIIMRAKSQVIICLLCDFGYSLTAGKIVHYCLTYVLLPNLCTHAWSVICMELLQCQPAHWHTSCFTVQFCLTHAGNCTEGQYISGDSCSLCPFGFYQPDRWQTSCVKCPTDRTTQRNGAVNVSECICKFQYTTSVWWDKPVCFLHLYAWLLEPGGFWEFVLVSLYMNECVFIYLCVCAWARASVCVCVCVNVCVCVCVHNIALQSFVWLCAVSCPPGKENKPGSNICTECQQGFYKNIEAAALCDPCPVGFVTRINGSTTRDDCELSE